MSKKQRALLVFVVLGILALTGPGVVHAEVQVSVGYTKLGEFVADAHPFWGTEVTIQVDMGDIIVQQNGKVYAQIDTLKADNTWELLEIAGEGTRTELELDAPTSGTLYSRQTLGVLGLFGPGFIDHPASFRLKAYLSHNADLSDEELVGETTFESTNLRIEDTEGLFKQVFVPSEEVRVEVKPSGTPDSYDLTGDVLSIYEDAGLSLSFPPPVDGVWTDVFHPGEGDYLIGLTVNQAPVPVLNIIPQFTTDPIDVTIGSDSDTAGADVVLPVMLGVNASGKSIVGTEFRIGYDVSKLSFTGLSLGYSTGVGQDPLLAGAGHTVTFNAVQGSGLVTVSSAGSSPLADPTNVPAPLFFLRFSIKDNASLGDSPVDFKFAELSARLPDPGTYSPLYGGHVLFADPHAGKVTVRAKPTAPGPPPPPLGDVNDSGQVTSLDAVYILKHIVGIPLKSGEVFNPEYADVNADNRVSPLDAALIFQFDALIITRLPGEPPPPQGQQAAKLVLTTGECVVAASEAMMAGDRMVVPVTMSDVSGMVAGEMKLAYDPTSFQVTGVSVSDGMAGLNLQSYAQAGRLHIAFAGSSPIEGHSGSVLVELRPLTDSESFGSPVAIEQVVLNDGAIRAIVRDESTRAGVLMQNNPNPFNPETQISYVLPAAGYVNLVIYSQAGQAVRNLTSGRQAAGQHAIAWDGRDDHGQSVASGVYVYRLSSGDFSSARRMVLVR